MSDKVQGVMVSSVSMGPIIRKFGFENEFFAASAINLFLVGFFYPIMKKFSRIKAKCPIGI
jgi:hypothetical protein